MIKTRPIAAQEVTHNLRDEKVKGPKPSKRPGAKPKPHRQGKGKH